MSDQLPPTDGLAPYDDRDLDALLSGEAACVPEPLARAVAALRAAPAPAELDGEAAARAAFRLFMVPDEDRQARPAAGRADGAATLMLPGASPDGGPERLERSARPPRPPRQRRRRVPWRGSRRAMALAGATAAAAVIVGVAALAGAFSGPGGRPWPAGPHSSATAPVAEPSGRPTSPVLEGGAAREPTVRPTPTPSGQPAGAGAGAAPAPEELCVQYFASGEAPGYSVIQQLTELAGGAWNISHYCDEQLGIAQPAPPGPNPGDPGNPGGGFGHPPGRGGSGPGPGHHGFGLPGGGRG